MTKPSDPIAELSEIVQRLTGVQLGAKARTMVKSRLQKRLLELGLKDEAEYWDHYQKNKSLEEMVLVSLLTTHYTFFFREAAHFEHLVRELPALAAAARARGDRKIRIWSAACSRGQEVYSLAMLLRVHLPEIAPDVTFEIEGSDVDPHSVEVARNGVYPRDELKNVPMIYQDGVWARGTGEIAAFVRAGKDLRAGVRFRQGNLLDGNDPGCRTKWDAIFCRNVFIYFSPEQIRESSQRLLGALQPGGYLYVGISESLSASGLVLETKGPSIYAAPGGKGEKSKVAAPPLASVPRSSASAPSAKPVPAPAAAMPPKLRVLCVDDSPSVLALLKRILSPEAGFEVVATATDGEDAKRVLREKTVDLITLDIHMPKMNGLELLKSWGGRPPAPVVTVSSVSREDASLALAMLEAGASDYVEKPELRRFEECREEIVGKLKSAWHAAKRSHRSSLSLDRSFAKGSKQAATDATRVLFFSYPDLERVVSFLKEGSFPDVPVKLWLDADSAVATKARERLEKALSKTLKTDGPIALYDRTQDPTRLMDSLRGRRIAVAVYGVPPSKVLKAVRRTGVHVQLEDVGNGSAPPEGVEVVPATSFAALSDEFLSKKAA